MKTKKLSTNNFKEILDKELKLVKKDLKRMEKDAKANDELWDDREFLASHHEAIGYLSAIEILQETIK